MAAAQHNPSRRALLGAAVGLPLVGGIGAESTPPPAFASGCGGSPSPSKLGEEWDRALAAFEAAAAEVRRIGAATAGCGPEEEEALLPAYDAACERVSGAVRGVMLARAPDVAALADKLALFFAHEMEPHSADERAVAAIRDDARRLAAAWPGAA